MMTSRQSTSDDANTSENRTIAILDAAYGNGFAAGACVLIDGVASATPLATRLIVLAHEAADYHPGEFYKRELPVLLALLDGSDAPDLIIIDGYVHLDADGRAGLGAHLHAALGGRIPIIGAAKTPFRGDDWSSSVLRGQSTRPLHVTAAGMEGDDAARIVRSLHGPHRIATMCKLADKLAREALADALAKAADPA